MQTLTINNQQAHVGELLAEVDSQPVTLEQHGEPVAVVMSKKEYDQLVDQRLALLTRELQFGADALRRGVFVEYNANGLRRTDTGASRDHAADLRLSSRC